ncbi:ABC transporter ATP-binding protein [Desulfopila sp. IMCC35008]|uniref:ABC transporter ATP-binding protein n=1 Tax=Desulfopila sp. IMCC35008 TaxID=2653858 RepID=UPI0013D1A51F|nr:ABC transporter ATP-binding protein [Desulfopila sp. IMCC35008]
MKKTKPGHTKPQTRISELLRLLAPSFAKHRLRLLTGFFALLGVDLMQLLIPRIIKSGVDGLSQQSIDEPRLLQLSGLIILFGILVAALRFSWRYLIIGFSRILERAVRDRIFSHILQMDAPFFEKHTTGDLMARSGNDMSSVQMACGMGLVAATDALMMSSAAICFMMYIHPKLTLLALLPMPFLAFCTRILSSKLHHRFSTVQEEFSLLTEFARSTLISIRLIKANTMEIFQTARFGDLGDKYVKSNLRVAVIQGLMHPIATLVGNLGMLLVLFYGGKLVIENEITIGDFVAFISYLYMLVWPMMAIGWVTNLVQRGLTSLGRIHSVVTSEPTLPVVINSGFTYQNEVSIQTKGLEFSYASSSQPALSDLNVNFTPGLHGITGRTGSGKSTLCKLLVRLYPVHNNQLLLNNKDINTLPVEYVRAHIGYVSQEPVLFSDTIRANIALGRPDATSAEIEMVAHAAAIYEDIAEFPNRFETQIGERGVTLSGGQRQRLALARALLCDRPVLIIDDGLSAVDVATEHVILQNLQQQLTGKTVIIVSNRIKLLSLTDRILVLEEGRVIHDGNHEQLFDNSDLYRSMYDKQMRSETHGEVAR